VYHDKYLFNSTVNRWRSSRPYHFMQFICLGTPTWEFCFQWWAYPRENATLC